jgi:hypothetical protein
MRVIFLHLIFLLFVAGLSGVIIDEHSFALADLPCGEPDVVLAIDYNERGVFAYYSHGVPIATDMLEDFIQKTKKMTGKEDGFIYAINYSHDYDAIFALYQLLSSYGDGEIYLIGDTVEKFIKLSSP